MTPSTSPAWAVILTAGRSYFPKSRFSTSLSSTFFSKVSSGMFFAFAIAVNRPS
jgi:hypothetical protein